MRLDDRSEAMLKHCHPALQKLVRHAASIGTVKFRITEGVRSIERQKELVRKKLSRTLNSRHITGHAVDLFPLDDSDSDGIRGYEDWDEFYALAKLMQRAAFETGVQVVWGGVWDKQISEYGDPKAEVAAYGARRRKLGRKAFVDGPHFELDREAYPA